MNFKKQIMSVKDKLNHIKTNIPENVTLVAVSKTKPVSEIMEAYDAGHKIFGENKVQEMTEKWEQMPKDIKWHMIGHVQRNKVKYMAEYVDLIHGVDSLKLLKEIEKQAKKYDRIIHCLFQVKIAEEDSKFGMAINKVKEILKSDEFNAFNHIKIVGFMGMSTFTDDNEQVKSEFNYLKKQFDDFQSRVSDNFKPEILSMGMSGDYNLAIECGSNMIRIGSSIFGARNYQ